MAKYFTQGYVPECLKKDYSQLWCQDQVFMAFVFSVALYLMGWNGQGHVSKWVLIGFYVEFTARQIEMGEVLREQGIKN